MPKPLAITIGNFDGVHLGHAALIAAAREAVGESGKVNALTFDPHPLTALQPDAAPPSLSTRDDKTNRLLALGVDEVTLLPPLPEVLSQSPREFVEFHFEARQPSFFVEGPNFRFGKARAGTVQTLRELGDEMNFETIIIDPIEAVLLDCTLVEVSSSMIRWLLSRGRVRDAAILLNRPYELQGEVVPGEQRGRQIGFPTVNLGYVEQLLPADGVYAGFATLESGQDLPAAISVGEKPTFGHHERVCEAHLLDYTDEDDLSEQIVALHFHHWLRDQLSFSNVDDLIAQMHRDVDRTRSLLQHEVTV